ncbi:MAG: HipA N-terminal domain-containing protein, partial [Alphaproteobacteria bacterium]|nr:HipA N-terminal domain-containing protein [Alphaproteobacteria bacterium]
LHPFFENLNAEGWLRDMQSKTTNKTLDLDILLAYGQDCIGAVGIQPDISENTLKKSTESEIPSGKTLSGVHKKLLVTKIDNGKFKPALENEPAPYIAKYNNPSYEKLVLNEWLSLRWMQDVLGKENVTDFNMGM